MMTFSPWSEDLEIKTKPVVMKRSSRLHELLGSLRPGARPLEGKSVYMHAVKSRHSAALTDVIRRLGGVSGRTDGRTEGGEPGCVCGGSGMSCVSCVSRAVCEQGGWGGAGSPTDGWRWQMSRFIITSSDQHL